MMLKKLAFVTIAATSMMIASAQTPQSQQAPKAETSAAKHAAPAKAGHKAKGTTHKAKASKHTSKKAHKAAKNEMQEQ